MTVTAQHADRGGKCQGKPGHMGRAVQQDVRADRRRVRQGAGAAAVGPGLSAEFADAVATSKARRARRREIWVEQACGKYFPVLSFFQQLSMGAKDDDRDRASGHADDGDRPWHAAPRSPPNARGRDLRALSAWQAAPPRSECAAAIVNLWISDRLMTSPRTALTRLGNW